MLHRPDGEFALLFYCVAAEVVGFAVVETEKMGVVESVERVLEQFAVIVE